MLGMALEPQGQNQVEWPLVGNVVKSTGWSLPKARSEGPPFITKSQIVKVLEQVGVLLELDGANQFRVIAYQNASRALASLEEDLLTVVSEERITDVKGIGKGLGLSLIHI